MYTAGAAPTPENTMRGQVTGNALRVGDRVRRAVGTPGPAKADRPLGTMEGTVTKVFAGRGSGDTRQRLNKVRVAWDSGSEATHDAVMIVAVRRE